MKYVYGPVPSRRLGSSLGVSVTPKKTCNYSCIYCQIGKTNLMINKPQSFFEVKNIIEELKTVLSKNLNFDVITIAGDGEPTLFKDLYELIIKIKSLTTKPLAVITNGSLLFESEVKKALYEADIVLPTLDFYDEASFKKINRHHKDLSFKKVYQGLIDFSFEFKGKIWLEMMVMEGVNDSKEDLEKFKLILKEIKYDRLYINTANRPPQDLKVKALSYEKMLEVSKELNAISLDVLAHEQFLSVIEDEYEAILNITQRHPMNQFEVESFLNNRKVKNKQEIFERLAKDPKVKIINYKGIDTYNIK